MVDRAMTTVVRKPFLERRPVQIEYANRATNDGHVFCFKRFLLFDLIFFFLRFCRPNTRVRVVREPDGTINTKGLFIPRNLRTFCRPGRKSKHRSKRDDRN